jgi:hypothetical protein
MLNHVQSWLYVGWFEIHHGFIGLPGLYGLKYHFGDCYRTCALINWMVLSQMIAMVMIVSHLVTIAKAR